MKKILFLFFIAAGILSAQNEQKSIELPDFVITGKQSIDVPTVQKKKPELISTLSQEFFTPQYSPVELPLLISSEPVPMKPNIVSENYYNGSIEFGLGKYSLPTGKFHIGQSFGNYVFAANLWGSNIKEYEANSGYNNSGVSLDNTIFVGTKSSFLPGTQVKLKGEYSQESYKFFASLTPTLERKINSGLGSFSFSNNYMRWIGFGFEFGGKAINLKENNLSEKNIFGEGLLEIKLGKFSVGGKGYYQKQILQNNLSGRDGYDFLNSSAFAKINFIPNMLIDGGISYSTSNSSNFFSPYVSVQFLLTKGITLAGEFKPYTEFNTISDFLEANPYMNNRLTDNVFSKIKSNFTGSIKYEFEKYFSITLSGRLSLTDKYIYYGDLIQKGIFDIMTAKDVKKSSIELTGIWHPAQLGYFNGNINYQSVKDNNSKIVPYEPEFFAQFIYGYDFYFGLGVKLNYLLANNTYTDLANTNKLESYNNFSLGLSYRIWENLSFTVDFHNILNRSNFVLKDYKEKPLDFIFGINYRW